METIIPIPPRFRSEQRESCCRKGNRDEKEALLNKYRDEYLKNPGF